MFALERKRESERTSNNTTCLVSNRFESDKYLEDFETIRMIRGYQLFEIDIDKNYDFYIREISIYFDRRIIKIDELIRGNNI